MKIGILTFHRALNYGAVLQCYALYETLKNKGYDVEVIDYRPSYIEKHRKLFYKRDFKKMSMIEKMKYIIKTPLTYWSKQKASKTFDSFLLQHFRFSRIVKKISDIPSCYNIIFFGSDQIWSPKICEGFDPVYWGQFSKKNTINVAYAPSIEDYENLTLNQWDDVIRYLYQFNMISVREQKLKIELERRLPNIKVECVLDPTLLVSSNIIKSIAVKPNCKNYILLFTVQERNFAYLVAKKMAETKGLNIVTVNAIPRLNMFSKEKDVQNYGTCSPDVFLGLILYAQYIVTNSFHATAISIKMQKEFLCAKCSRPLRIMNILDAVHLRDRYISDINELTQLSTINYTDVFSLLNKYKENSEKYLLNSISNNQFA